MMTGRRSRKNSTKEIVWSPSLSSIPIPQAAALHMGRLSLYPRRLFGPKQFLVVKLLHVENIEGNILVVFVIAGLVAIRISGHQVI